AGRRALPEARIAAPCVRRSLSVPTPCQTPLIPVPPYGIGRCLRLGYREVNAGLGGAAGRVSIDVNDHAFRENSAWATSIRPRKSSCNSGPVTGRDPFTC